tara:strand:+ start:13162 stop:13410 length:249 start_codon:yes stop_codon:yes gene_type:complete
MDEILKKRRKLRSRYINYKPLSPLNSTKENNFIEKTEEHYQTKVHTKHKPEDISNMKLQNRNQTSFNCCQYLFETFMKLFND